MRGFNDQSLISFSRFLSEPRLCRPVPLHPLILDALLEWKRQSLYESDGDFLFPSIRLNGKKPLSPDSLLKKNIRPAFERAKS